MQPTEKIYYRNHLIEIHQDTTAGDPREWDNLGTMYCCHRRYNLGDEQPDPDWLRDYADEVIEDGGVVLPLYLYDHGVISMRTRSFVGRAHHAEWDSGMVGFIIATRQDIYHNWSIKRVTKNYRERTEKILKAEVKEYDQFLRGETYGYITFAPDGKHHDDETWTKGDEIDSCWGFFGSDWEENGLFDYAKPSIDNYIEQCWKEHTKKVKTMIKNRVPLLIREQQLATSNYLHQ